MRAAGSSPRLRGTPRRTLQAFPARRFIPAPAGNAASHTVPTGGRPVHPRACGEREAWYSRNHWRGGSSPRLRGTPQPLGAAQRRKRFIPAPAGNAGGGHRPECRPPVHPRACGERRRIHAARRRKPGSSPRLRGTLWQRSTAYAWTTVHPRACGERRDIHRRQQRQAGSSPRLRGTPDGQVQGVRARRFIPAPAGNALPKANQMISVSVHPRACGERWVAVIEPDRDYGSSPRLRGTLGEFGDQVRATRFIPAPAGNALLWGSAAGGCSVHPRACGERMLISGHALAQAGSSPRLRGTPGRGRRRHPGQRFIPAPAGNARCAGPAGRGSAVHPRACGERLNDSTDTPGNSGSSPRLRGTPSQPVRATSIPRFIPAPAGNAHQAAK